MQEQEYYTTVQLLTLQREQIEQLQFKVQAAERRPVLLREMTQMVVAAGVEVIARRYKLSFAPNDAFVDSE